MPHGSTPAGVAVLLAAYLVGSIPIALLLGRVGAGVDLRRLGSGNPGTSNLFRNAGLRLAVLSGPLQFFQGVLPVVLARVAGGNGTFLEATALCAVAGNGWPIWLRFNGQRCIAVATGAVAALNLPLLGVLLLFFAAGALLRVIAVGVLAGFTVLPLLAAWLSGPQLAVTCALMLVAVLLRRLEGLVADLHRPAPPGERHLLMRRLFLDQRPGQVLAGPREDRAAGPR
ncbi:MAG: glycerol-3-phosphate acyltransferase [Candidatus Dormibacteraeota bacterium]|nr:glycerol-3-phosphate acyltransferase [Candidatus Dormibacteraeota bacterium]